ncbi:MAG: DUF2085 domain-containing protein [Pyrinomonadaceae bacterium]
MSLYLPPDQYIPQFVADRRPLIVWGTAVTVALLLVTLILGAPLAQANGYRILSFGIYEAFSYVCHQAPERSFFIAGHKLAVCARCAGLYGGFAGALILYPLITRLRRTDAPERKWLFIAAAPLAIDFSLGLFGIWENTHFSRFLTGALLGAVVVFYIMPGLVDLSRYSKSRVAAGPQERRVPAVQFDSPGKTVTAAPSDYSSPHRRI